MVPPGAKIPEGAGGALIPTPVPRKGFELVHTRINIRKADFEHAIKRHMNPSVRASQFIITPEELRRILMNKHVINAPVYKAPGKNFYRTVDMGYIIGTDKFRGHAPTSKITIFVDRLGNLETAFPGGFR